MLERVVIINDRSAAVGGASGLALLSARLFAERGVPVTYVTGDAGEVGEAGAPDLPSMEILSLGGAGLTERGALSALTTGLYNPAAAKLMARTIEARDGPGVVYHLHGWSKILSPSILGPLRAVRERLLVHAHDYFLACPNGGFMDYQRQSPCLRVPLSGSCLATHCDKRSYAQKLWRSARHAVRQTTFDLASAPSDILLIHPGMAPHFRRIGVPAHRLVPLRNPVDHLRCNKVAAAANMAAFFVGRIEPEKGFPDAVAAAQRARVPLHVVGDGPIRAEMERRHPEVRFHGWCDRKTLASLLGNARLLIMPTRYPEPFGLVAVEALRCGVPVVVSDSALLAPEIASQGMGVAFRAGDVEGLSTLLAALARDDTRSAAMSRAAFARGGDLAHTPQSWADALLRRYEHTLRRARGIAVAVHTAQTVDA